MSMQDVLKPTEANQKIKKILTKFRIRYVRSKFIVQKKYWCGWFNIFLSDKGKLNFLSSYEYEDKSRALSDIKKYVNRKFIIKEIIPVTIEDLKI